MAATAEAEAAAAPRPARGKGAGGSDVTATVAAAAADTAAAPSGVVYSWCDAAVVSSAEALKTLTQQSFQLGGQIVDGAASWLMGATFEPGYASARRGRIAADTADRTSSEDSASSSSSSGRGASRTVSSAARFAGIAAAASGDGGAVAADTGGSASTPPSGGATDGGGEAGSLPPLTLPLASTRPTSLEHANDLLRHTDQPTGANRAAPGVVEEVRLGTLVAIDAAAGALRRALARMCAPSRSPGAAPATTPSGDGAEDDALHGTRVWGCCRRRHVGGVTMPPASGEDVRPAPAAAGGAGTPADAPPPGATGALAPTAIAPVRLRIAARRPWLVEDPLAPSPSLVSGGHSRAPRAAGAGGLRRRALRASTPQSRSGGGGGGSGGSSPVDDGEVPGGRSHSLGGGRGSASARQSGGDGGDVSPAYWPMPHIARVSVACRLIDTVCGYPVQVYGVRTVDGYILTLVRIPRPESRRAVLFMHGLLDSASAWVSTGNVHSLGARAYAEGYDVFLGNMRGSNDALGVNGLGSNPVDRAAAATAAAPSHAAPAGGGGSGGGAARDGAFVGTSSDGVPVHETLHPRQTEFWNYGVDDHALDVMAFMRQIRLIKAVEAPERRGRSSGGVGAAAAATAAAATAAAATAASGGGDGVPPRRVVEATATAADDCTIAAVGHSMGGCVLLLYIMIANALGRPHWLDKVILLSPAGLHRYLPWVFRVALNVAYRGGLFGAQGPFPARSSTFQRFAARLLQDAKRLPAVGDLMGVLGSYFFGGQRHRFVFSFVSFTEYPVGGTNFKVLRHGAQCALGSEFQPYDYAAGENQDRYHAPTPPSYRADYGLLDAPIHIVAGGRDFLVPPANLEEQYALFNMVRPGIATLREFTQAGHLDFTLTLADDIISHVLEELAATVPRVAAGLPPVPPAPRDFSTLYAAAAAAATTAATVPDRARGGGATVQRDFGVREWGDAILAAPPIQHQLHRLATVACARAHSLPSNAVVTAPPPPPIPPAASHLAHAPPASRWAVGVPWRPAAVAAVDYPWLAGFTKWEAAWQGMDAEARELGLAPPRPPAHHA